MAEMKERIMPFLHLIPASNSVYFACLYLAAELKNYDEQYLSGTGNYKKRELG
jgi:hypothetical protein